MIYVHAFRKEVCRMLKSWIWFCSRRRVSTGHNLPKPQFFKDVESIGVEKRASSIKVMSKVGWKNKVRCVQNVSQLKKLQVLDTLTYLSWVLMTYVQWFEETACVTNMPSIINLFPKRSSLCSKISPMNWWSCWGRSLYQWAFSDCFWGHCEQCSGLEYLGWYGALWYGGKLLLEIRMGLENGKLRRFRITKITG